MPALTLLVPVRDPGPELDGLVASVDAQVASRDTFDVVFVDGGSHDATPVRLARLAAARPNVSLLSASADLDLAGLVRAGFEQGASDLVAVVRPGERLTVQAVSLVVAAAAGGADAVLGRRSSVPDGDGPPLVDGPVGAGPRSWRGGLLAVRRSTLESSPEPADTLLDPALLDPGWDVVALGSVACLGRPWPDGGPVTESQLRWSGTELVVETALAPEDEGATVWLLLARADSAEEVSLPAQVVHGSDGGLLARGSIDLAPAGHQGDGVWHVRLRIRSDGSDRTVALAGASPVAAVLRGRQVVPSVTPGGLMLDVAATRSSLVGRVPVGDASIVETPRGVQLTLRCRNVHVVGDTSTPVAVFLGRFRLPAVLVCAGGSAHVEAWVSGLAGRSRISVLTGRGKPRRTGLDLRIAATGEMTLGRTPRPARPGQPGCRAQASQTSGLERLRERVPAGLGPVIERLARIGPLRAAYRRVTRR